MSISSKGAAIVTGGAQGIGRAVALKLAEDGFDVAINDVKANLDAVSAVLDEITAKGKRGIAILGDVSSEGDVKEMVEKVIAEFGTLDVMVANAGIALNKPLDKTTVEEWDRLFSVNARGTFLCYKYAAIQMIKQGRGGRIIGACSTAGKKGIPEAATYCATKFAIRGLTQSAALEYGKHGITVNAYAPGAIDTPFLGNFDKYHTDKSGGKAGSWQDSLKNFSATGTNGTPDDVAALVSYFASKEARFVTGQSVLVDGGTIFD